MLSRVVCFLRFYHIIFSQYNGNRSTYIILFEVASVLDSELNKHFTFNNYDRHSSVQLLLWGLYHDEKLDGTNDTKI